MVAEWDVLAQAVELDAKLIEAFRRRDLDALLEQYWNHDDLFTIGESGAVTRGWDAARAFQERFFSIAESIEFTFGEWHYEPSAQMVLAAAPFELAYRMKGGGEQTSEGWYTNVRRWIDRRWLVVFEHISSNVEAG